MIISFGKQDDLGKMKEQEARFIIAKLDYEDLIAKDFPGFDLEKYCEEKRDQAEEPEPELEPELDAGPDVQAGDSRPGKPVIKLDKDSLGNAAKSVGATVKKAGKTISSIDREDIKDAAAGAAAGAKKKVMKAGKAISSIDAPGLVKGGVSKVGGALAGIDKDDVKRVQAKTVKIGKIATGVQGLQDRKEAKQVKEICGEYYNAAEAVTEINREELNAQINEFGEYRLRSLHETLGRFLQYLKELKQNNKVKEYEILEGIGIDTKTLDEMERIDMAASEMLRTSVISGVFGAVAVAGTPALVTGAVAALATASTGTAISTLSGAAAQSAIMAWLGGGSIAAGGGGMAAGAVVLTTITVGATAGVAIIAAGIMISTHYGRKLTEAKEYEKDVGVAVANFEKAWVAMGGISDRVLELLEVTKELEQRTTVYLDKLAERIPDFDNSEPECVTLFNKCGHLVKTMVELAQTPLLDDDGNLTVESTTIKSKVRKVLNTEV